ncbi:N-acyl-D-amino-acid deacylase family protein [Sphingopyxis sp. RIFCSPHIGHO2_12_FULL_65_19]|uniref:N-acyl-D-amino-acid deacylase family protein n=1 Tax=Sphingopyxis sp. RIFCSPHIGHO2_12_FULL_65_19 TaxID=1802172 RepID=UPI0008B615C6|nr:D-aminoacylase [Sphingopyxis sp. RIFCSPHIGHO2_12_FULL_65_19]OHD09913.1 MAG: D-aminoacylase [Sphingopyxis sp. RIFCSPHIGHO2_12_FULL_65_19]
MRRLRRSAAVASAFRRARTARALAVAACAALLVSATPAADYDIVIRGGRLLDGAGNPWVHADVGIKDGRIAKIGRIAAPGAKVIDATGKYVSPGFIDMMDQSGAVLLKSGAAENKLRMGVTTLIGGEGGTPVPAGRITQYFDDLARRGIAVNFGTYYSATQARVEVMGDAAGAPTSAQIDQMGGLVDTAMKAGAFGISTALMYPPDSFQSTEDLIALAKVSARCGGFYATHLRDESARLVESVDEAIRIGEESGAKVEIFHLKAAYAPGWGTLMPRAIANIGAARARGLDIAADIYPYTAAGTGLEGTVPAHVFAQGTDAAIAKLRDPAMRARLKQELAAGSRAGWSSLVEAAGGWRNIVLANSHRADTARLHGKNFVEIGAMLDKDPADAAWDIMLDALPERAFALYFVMDEADIDAAIKQPWVGIGSDGAAAEKLGELDGMALPHPRSYGTFARVLAEYVRNRQILPLEDAVRKMTSWPAHRLGLADRGVLREGLRADVIVFDLDDIRDHADWAAPTRPATGIDHVIVNGVLALEQGRHTGARSGMVLRHSCDG